MESLTGVFDAISKGNLEQLHFFFPRVKKEIVTEISSKLWSGDFNFLLEFLPDPSFISIPTLRQFFVLAGFSSPIEENPILTEWFNERDYFGYSISFSDQVIAQSGDAEKISQFGSLSKYPILHRMIDHGSEQALEILIPLDSRRYIFHSVLRSGKIKLLERILPLIENSDKFFFAEEAYEATAYGGNPQMLDFLFSKNDLKTNEEVDWTDLSSKIIHEAILGFFVHRDLPSTYVFLTKLPLVQAYFPYSSTRGLPIDLIELILNLPTPEFSSRDNFNLLLNFLKYNLGYINTVFFLLDKLDSTFQISTGSDCVDESDREDFFYEVDQQARFYPLSVQLVRARSSGWKIV